MYHVCGKATPDGSTVSQQARFQTEVLATLMEHLLAADVLIGEQAALPVVAGGNAANITPNVCYLTARIVDKLWQGASFTNHSFFISILFVDSSSSFKLTNEVTPLQYTIIYILGIYLFLAFPLVLILNI